MRAAHHRWLLEQLPQWQQEGLVTAEAAETLRQRAHAAADTDTGSGGLAQIVMGVLGALLVGAGLIAIIGYNWDDFGKPARLGCAFVPLLLAQLFSGWLLRRGESAAIWQRETAALLQALTAMGALAIVSQIYNLGGEWPEFLLVCCLLMLPLIWIFTARCVAILYLGGIAAWTAHQVDMSSRGFESPWMYLPLFAFLRPYLVRLRQLKMPLPVSVRWFGMWSLTVGLCAVAVQANQYAESRQEETYFWMWMLNAAVLTLIPLSEAGRSESVSRKPQVVLGFLTLLGFGLALTFADVSKDGAVIVRNAMAAPWTWVLLGALFTFAGMAVWHKRFAILAVAGVALLPFFATIMSPTAVSWLATAYLFLAGLTLILLEFTEWQGAPRLGAALLSLLILVRFTDSDLSLLLKGIVFVIVGSGFLAFNLFIGRHRRARRFAS